MSTTYGFGMLLPVSIWLMGYTDADSFSQLLLCHPALQTNRPDPGSDGLISIILQTSSVFEMLVLYMRFGYCITV